MNRVILIIVLLLVSNVAQAITINVPSEQPTIQAGIDFAVIGDTVLVADGTYTGDGNRDIDFFGKNIVVMSTNGPEFTIIDCEGSGSNQYRAFRVVNGESSDCIIDGFMIINGHTPSGGAIWTEDASPTIKNCIFDNNYAGNYGGAIFAEGFTANITNCIFSNNYAHHGGAFCYSNMSNPQIESCLFESNNSREFGSAIFCYQSNSTINNSTFVSNTSDLAEGVVYISNSGPTTIGNCIIAFCANGMAVEGPANLNCCDIYGNAGGDWTYNIAGQLGIEGNISEDPLFCDSENDDYTLTNLSPCLSSCGLIGKYNLGCDYPNLPLAKSINYTPSYDDTITYSTTPEIHWSYFDTLATSQSEYEIEVGTDDDWSVAEMWSSGQVISSDQFTVYSGLELENLTTYNVRIRVTDGDVWGDWRGSYFLLRVGKTILVPSEASTIHTGLSLASPGDTVLVADGIYPSYGNRDSDFDGKDIVVMSENGPKFTIIDIQGSSSDRHRGFIFHNGETSSAKLIGFSIINGYRSDNGGAIYINNSSPTIENCIFYNNFSGGVGGAIYCFNSSSMFINCTMVNNSADQGGGIYSYAAQPVLNNCIIAQNIGGGAIYCSSNGEVELNCCNLFNNIGGNYTNCASGQLGLNGNISQDPEFCDFDQDDFSLASSSPCLASNNSCSELIGALDQGCTSPVIYSTTYHVYSNGSGDAITIQDAIDLTINGDTIVVGNGTYSGEGNRDLDYSGKAIVVMSERGPERTIIDCEGSDIEPHRGFNFISGETSSAKLIGFSIINGYSPYVSHHSANEGGAIYIENSSPTIENCIFGNNNGVDRGGAIYIENSSTAIEYCMFYYNSVLDQGGAVACYSSTATFTSCTIVKNSADLGGGIYADNAQLSLDKCIIAHNDEGGATYCINAGTVALLCCDLYDNVGGDYEGCASGQLGVDGNISGDPEICDIVNGDFSINHSSPCAPDNNVCNSLIGAGKVECDYICGNANSDSSVNVSDAVYLIGYIFVGGNAPSSYYSGDANCDGRVNISDAVYIINYVFIGGADPCDPDNDGVPDC